MQENMLSQYILFSVCLAFFLKHAFKYICVLTNALQFYVIGDNIKRVFER